MNKIYFDTEFTGLSQNTTLISIGLVSETGGRFYAEFTDFDQKQVDEWLFMNVIKKLRFVKPSSSLGNGDYVGFFQIENLVSGAVSMESYGDNEIILFNDTNWRNFEDDFSYSFAGPKEMIAVCLKAWLDFIKQKTGAPSEMHGDHLSYDWVLFCQLFGGAMQIPESVYYIPQDLCTAFRENGIDPDTARVDFSEYDEKEVKPHNALFDAEIIKACFEKINRLKAQK